METGDIKSIKNNNMKCPTCGNKNPKKLFFAGLTFEEANLVACDKCLGKKKVRKKMAKK